MPENGARRVISDDETRIIVNYLERSVGWTGQQATEEIK